MHIRPSMRPMTEDQIERHAERMVDRLDHQFLSGFIGQSEYDQQQREIARWVDAEYRFARTYG